MDLLGRKILIVEDDEDIRDILKDFFEAEGCDVAAAVNGRAALDHLEEKGRPDLIFLDLMMPIMSGEEFVHHLKKNPDWAQTPIVIMSADHQTSKVAGELKIKNFVRKPITLRSLVAMAEEALGA
jgi:CheY-like chemotaxis protein